jgi:ABC-2 type transport system ATP-binding protein
MLAGLLRVPVRDEADPALLTATVPASRGWPHSAQAAAAVAELGRAAITVAEFALSQPSLDEAFMTLTSQPAARPAPVTAAAQTPAATR